MTSLFFYLSFILCVFSIGYSILIVTTDKPLISFAGFFSLSFSFGAWGLAYILFLCSSAGLKPSRGIILFIFILTLSFLLFKKNRWLKVTIIPKLVRLTFIEYALGGILLIPFVWVLLELTTQPVSTMDAMAIWGFKAKVLYHAPIKGNDYFYDVTKGFSHLDYPLLLPLLTSGMYAMVGGFHEMAGRSLHFWIFSSYIALLYYMIRQQLNVKNTLLLIIIFLSNLTLLSQSVGGHSDILLMLFYGGAVFFIFSWMQNCRTIELIKGALMASALVFTKHEGSALMAILSAVLFIWHLVHRQKNQYKVIIMFIMIPLILNGVWIMFSGTIPRVHENYMSHLNVVTFVNNFYRIPLILETFLKSMTNFKEWAALWGLLAMSLITGLPLIISQHTLYLWLILILNLTTYVIIFVVTPWDLKRLMDMKTTGLLLQTSPVVLLLISICWQRMVCGLKKDSSSKKFLS